MPRTLRWLCIAMAVTLPSAAGLGASGACMCTTPRPEPARSSPSRRSQPLARSTVSPSCADRCAAVTLMHIRHGQARWIRCRRAERMARSGVPVSSACRAICRRGRHRWAPIARRGASSARAPAPPASAGDTGRRAILRHVVPSPEGGVDFLPGIPGAGVVGSGGADGRQPAARVAAQQPAGHRAPAGESYGGFRSMSRPHRWLAPTPWLAGTVSRPAAGVPADSGGFFRLAAIDERAARRLARCRWASSSGAHDRSGQPASCWAQ